MHTIVFEDDAVSRLGDLVAVRPACDLSIGSTSLAEGLAGFGTVTRILRPHLARHLEAVCGRRVPFWGARDPAESPHAASRHGAVVLLANARLVPGRSTLAALRALAESGHEGVVADEGTVLAALVKVGPGGDGPSAIVSRLATAADPADEVLRIVDRAIDLPVRGELRCLATPTDLLDAHEREFEPGLAMRIDSGKYREIRKGLFVAESVEIVEPVVVRGGPVVVEAGATVGPFTCLDGPVWIGERTRVHPHAWLRQGTAAGHDCRIGGEAEASVLEPFSNKPHEGFLGHSHLGSWVNLAAGTITGNLKATYGTVRLRDAEGRTLDTARQFVGAFVGDLVRTAIHTSIACGCSIGPASSVGGDVSGAVPAFATTLHADATTTDAERAFTVLSRMMARRGIAACEADRRLLADLAAARGYSGR